MLSFNYLDAVTEQQMPMTAAKIYWLENLHDFKIDQSPSLPFDRYRLSNEHSTDRGISVTFDFGEDFSQAFLTYSSLYNTKLEHLALACYFGFLFKLTNGEKDICVSMKTHNRHKDELRSMIGLFENVIPLRCQLDPLFSFQELDIHTKKILTNGLEYSYFPLQRILAQHPNASKPAFLNLFFEFQSNENQFYKNEIVIGDAHFYPSYHSNVIDKDTVANKYDFSLLIQHDSNTHQLSCSIHGSLDLFDEETIQKITQRFHSMLEQLFLSTDYWIQKPVYEISLVLPNEQILMKAMNNTQVLFSPSTCIHHEFIYQAMKHPQKLAVELDEQSLTYSELLHYVQLLAVDLICSQRIVPGDIVCQCVERSLSMVSRSKKYLCT